MANSRIVEAAAIRLAELSREIDELEDGRTALLERVDLLRAELQTTGQRTAAMRASVDLVCEHIADVAAALAELKALEEEMRVIGQELDETGKETSAILFEANSLRQTVDDAEEELERLSAILVEGKSRHPRGH